MVQTQFKGDCVKNAGGAALPYPAFGVFGSLSTMSRLQEYLLQDLRQDWSRKEQEEEMEVGRNSRRERVRKGGKEERRKGGKGSQTSRGLNVYACEIKVRLNNEFLDTKSGDWNQNWRPTRVELADIDLDNGRLLLRRRIR